MDDSIDILMATYNGENFLDEQIESIINQSYKNWTLFIHDDNSKDSTVDIIKKWCIKDKRIQFLNDGVCFGNSSENFIHLAITCVHSDYFCFSDQDDFWLPEKLEKSISFFKMIENDKSNIPVCIGTDLKVADENLNIINESFYEFSKILRTSDFETLLIDNSFTGCTMMMNKFIVPYLKKIKTLNQTDKIVQHDWIIAQICASDGVVAQLNQPTILYRQHSNNVVGANKFDLRNKLNPFDFVKSLKRVFKLKKKIFFQNALLNLLITNETKKKNLYVFLKKSFLRKFRLLEMNVYKSASFSRAVIKFVFY